MNTIIQLIKKIYQYLTNVASGIVGRTIRVHKVPDGNNALGYTLKGSDVYVAYEHSLFKGLSDEEKDMVRLGVTVHESLHQVFTNFSYYERKVEKLRREAYFQSKYDEYVFHELWNLVEDPAIETAAPEVVGGLPLKALKFAILTIDNCSDYTSTPEDEVSEVTSALIQFGDIGLVRGGWTFDKAREVFLKIAPLFYDAINDPDSASRIDRIPEIHKEIRTLYREGAEPKNNNLSRSSTPEGTGEGRTGKTPSEKSELNRKRKITIKKVKRDEWEKMKKESEKNPSVPDDGESDITVVIPEDLKPEDMEKKEKEKDNTSVPIPKSGNEEDKEEDKEEDEKTDSESDDAKKKENGKEDEEKDSETNGSDKSLADSEKKGEEGSAEEYGDEESENPFELSDEEQDILDEDDFELSDEDLERIVSSILSCEEGEEHNSQNGKSEEEIREKQAADDKSDIVAKELHTRATCQNHLVTAEPGFESVYDRVKEPFEADIEMLRDELREIFQQDETRTYFARSGRVSLKRLVNRTASTRLFERTERTTGKANIAIYMMVDMSGSTWGKKIEQERLTAILTAEALSEFKIPLYITGFTDNEEVELYHFVRWDNTEEERQSLLKITALNNNFDAYAVRYAEEALRERPEMRKLFIMISDGQPASYFSGGSQGIRKNAEAVMHMKEAGIDVIAFGVGNVPDEIFKTMYGEYSYINVSNPARLFDNLSRVLRNVIDGEDKM